MKQNFNVLITGAFGNIGSHAVRESLQRGYKIACFDLKTPANEKRAQELDGQIECIWGDLGNPATITPAVQGRDAVLHVAAVIPPLSEQKPDLTARVNIVGTKNLVEAMTRVVPQSRLVFTSSISVFGDTHAQVPPRKATDPVRPSDHYSRSKVACEDIIHKSGLKSVICRLSATPPVTVSTKMAGDMAVMFDMPQNLRVEYVHPGDVARALVNAVSCDEAIGKTILIGGGPRCQLLAKDFVGNLLEAMGIGRLPAEAYGPGPYYLDWLDTGESERLLKFQQVTYEDYLKSMVKSVGGLRYVIKGFRPLIRRYLLTRSKYWKAYKESQKPAKKAQKEKSSS